jgi:hypothetical protein
MALRMGYVDDFIIFSKSFAEHLQHLEEVFKKLQEYGIYAKLTKCCFGVKELDFLGHTVSKDGVKANGKKIAAIEKMEVPKDSDQVRRFLGMAGFYRKYIRNFASRTENMRELTKKDAKFNWTLECEKEWKDIKQALTTNPVMAYPNFEKEFTLATDASIKGLGAILSQNYDQGERVIAYASRSLNEHEKKYGITKLEALAVVWATETFKPYLVDHKFELITDHKALLKLNELKDTNPMLERWSIKLSQYQYRVTYREGRHHENADCLSRDPINGIDVSDELAIAKAQQEDSKLGKWFKELEKGEARLILMLRLKKWK